MADVITDNCETCGKSMERLSIMVVLYGKKKLPKNVTVLCSDCEAGIDLSYARV